jgi:hypothetical protein
MASSAQPERIQDILNVRKPEDGRPSKMILRIMAGIVVTTVIGSVAYVQIALSARESHTQSNATRAVYPAPSTIGLSGTKTGRDIHITWNPHSSTFSDVRIGMLTIKDGGSHREIALTGAELRARKIIYSPTTDRVEASLELFSPDRKSTRESVLFVLDPSENTPPRVVAQRTVVPGQQDAGEPSDAEMRSRTDIPVAQPVRAFIPPSTTQRPANAEQVTMLEPPAVKTAETGTLSAANVQPPARSATGAYAADLRAREQKVSTQQPLSAAQTKYRKPIRQVSAQLPSNILAMLRESVQVDVRARIDSSGRVVDAESLASANVLNRYLGTAAVNAARLWQFEPGEDVAVILKFTFNPR